MGPGVGAGPGGTGGSGSGPGVGGVGGGVGIGVGRSGPGSGGGMGVATSGTGDVTWGTDSRVITIDAATTPGRAAQSGTRPGRGLGQVATRGSARAAGSEGDADRKAPPAGDPAAGRAAPRGAGIRPAPATTPGRATSPPSSSA